MSWKIKTDPETNAPVMDEGKIFYIDPDGKELPLDPPAMYEKISSLGKENQSHRTKYEKLQEKYKQLGEIEDINAWYQEATKAMEAVANFNDKDWMKAEKVDQLKREMASAYEDKLKNKDLQFAEKEKTYTDGMQKLQGQIRSLLVSNKFAVSKYFSGGGDKSVTILPSTIAEDHFGKYFKVEESSDGLPTIKAYYPNGDPVLSKVNPGEPADFEEAMGLIIDKYPGKETILRSTSGGSGSAGGKGDPAGSDSLSVLRAQYTKAQEEGNAQLAVSLKRKIFELQQQNAA